MDSPLLVTVDRGTIQSPAIVRASGNSKLNVAGENGPATDPVP